MSKNYIIKKIKNKNNLRRFKGICLYMAYNNKFEKTLIEKSLYKRIVYILFRDQDKNYIR